MPEETKVIERPDSCKISVNAKGDWSGEVKVYAATIEEAMAKCVRHADDLVAEIRKRNP